MQNGTHQESRCNCWTVSWNKVRINPYRLFTLLRGDQGSDEFLVKRAVLQGTRQRVPNGHSLRGDQDAMKAAGLVPIAMRNFIDWWKENPHGQKLSPEQLAISCLNMSFVFVKPALALVPVLLSPIGGKRVRDENAPPDERALKKARA